MTFYGYLPWLCSALAILSCYLMAHKSVWSPIVSAVGFIPWTLFTIHVQAWGLLPADIVILMLNVRCIIHWSSITETSSK